MNPLRTGVRTFAIALATGGSLLAQVPPPNDIPNWAVPATWSPARASGGYGTMTDISQALPFVAIAPCRIADTRGLFGFAGQAGGPIVPSNTTRFFQIGGAPATVPAPPNGCAANSIPMGAAAVSFQFTIVSPSADGNLIAWPAAGAQPSVSSLNWPAGTVALGNGTIVPLSAGFLAVRLNMAVGQSAHLVIDVNGYFSPALPPSGPPGASSHPLGFTGNLFDVHGESDFTVAHFVNSNESSAGRAIEAQAESSANGTTGVLGLAGSGSANSFGGRFQTFGTGFNSAGVKGVSANGDPLGASLDTLASLTAGVRGVDDSTTSGFGVIGISRFRGVGGVLLDATDMTSPLDTDAEGYLGYRSGMTFYGVLSFGGTGGTGIKSFVEPHATDPSKVIRYVSLEGPEAGTYFRGKARFVRGMATIEVPEDFRMVSDREGLTIQVTPIGEMATFAVVSIGLDRIVVKASRNVEFFYLVHGVRATFKDHTPIGDGVEFMPRKAEATIPGYLSEGQKRLLIQNGTYKADGTVNLETAHRLGWDRVWEEQRRPIPRPENDTGATGP